MTFRGPTSFRGFDYGYDLATVLYFTADGSFSKSRPTIDGIPARALRVGCQGGGGGGGGHNGDGTGGSGGGGGGYAESFITDLDLVSDPISITVGLGGTAGPQNGAGGGGGASSFGALVVGGGGGGGSTAVSTGQGFGGGGGGGTGDLVIPGAGGMIHNWTNFGVTNCAYSGYGGKSFLGGGGAGSSRTDGGRGDGFGGNLYGGGGGGGVRPSGSGGATAIGGPGANGIVIVEVYV